MRTAISWIAGPWPGRLGVAPRPSGGAWLEEDIRFWRREGVDGVVSLLTPDETLDRELEREPDCCRAAGMDFLSFPIVDRGVPPSALAVHDLAEKLAECLRQGHNVLIHCRAGLGRSPLLAACVLALGGVTSQDAFKRISTARGFPVPDTLEQSNWVADFARTFG